MMADTVPRASGSPYAATPIPPADLLADMEHHVLGVFRRAGHRALSRDDVQAGLRAAGVRIPPELEASDVVRAAIERLETDLGRIERLPSRGDVWRIIGRGKRRRLR